MDETSLKHCYAAREAARAILRFTAGRSYEDYCADEMLSAASLAERLTCHLQSAVLPINSLP